MPFSKRLLRHVAAVAAAVLAAGAAQADGPTFNVRGFGTLGISRADNQNADFVTNAAFQPTGAGASHKVAASVDSKLGVQFDSELSERFSAVLQLVSQQNYDNSYVPHVEWANLSYKITPDLTLRVGRTLWPVMLTSETRNIGYGNPLVRNSSEMIANMPNTFSDGVDATYKFSTGPANHALTVLAGKAANTAWFRSDNGERAVLDVFAIRGISLFTDIGNWRWHAAYMTMKYDIALPGLPLLGVRYKTATLGFNYDPGNWFVTADYLHADDAAFGLARAYTAAGGVRLGSFSPYVSTSVMQQRTVGYSGIGTPGDKQVTSSVGVRWDFRSNMSLKLQYERQKTGPVALLFPNSLNIYNVDSFLANPKVNVVSLVYDFVF